jgi:hypothetical protein
MIRADKLTAICEQIVWTMWEHRRLTALRASRACCRDSFTFTLPSAKADVIPEGRQTNFRSNAAHPTPLKSKLKLLINQEH